MNFLRYKPHISLKKMQVKITVLKQTTYPDLIETYELPQEFPCCVQVGQTWLVGDCSCPEGMCQPAWQTLLPFVKELLNGGGYFYGEWMRNPHSAMVSCNDGFRPATFLVEVYK